MPGEPHDDELAEQVESALGQWTISGVDPDTGEHYTAPVFMEDVLDAAAGIMPTGWLRRMPPRDSDA